MPSSAEQNLLFGIISLQMDFVRREQLVAATSTWLTDKSRGIDEILVEQGALSESDLKLLGPLVARHLENHDGDPQQSLAALSSITSVADELRSLGDESVDATLSMVASDRPDELHAETVIHESKGSTVASSPSSAATDARFRVLRSHAKGGLGEVYVAKDTELNREVALKEIQTKYADDENSRLRFLLEAEVTGGLEHPGIVPVYGLGRYEDGRPFYAMRFIKGDSLQEAADRFHGHIESDAETGDGENANKPDFACLEFRKLLGRFIDVCQAIEYAHSRGVLHRDLKPGNIMLGKYGETLVVDWGLAKAQGRDESDKVEGETTLRPASASGSTPTLMGSAIGTPAFMPPEQASGELDKLGPASDVYSLGATLYYLLTGQAPFSKNNLSDLLDDVRHGQFPSPSSIRKNVPRAISAICLKAMSLTPGDRYESPQQLSGDVERYLGDEPVTADVEPLVTRARRWLRKHQTLAVATAAVLLVSFVGLGVISTIVTQKNARLTQLNGALDSKNIELAKAKDIALANEQAARRQSHLTLSTLSAVVDDIQGGLRNMPGGGDLRRRLLTTSLEKLESVSTGYLNEATVDRATLVAMTEMGDVVMQFGVPQGPGAIVPDERLGDSTQRTIIGLAESLYRRALEMAETLAKAAPTSQEAQEDLATSCSKLADLLTRTDRQPESLGLYQRSLDILLDLAEATPNNTAVQREVSVGYGKLADIYAQLGRHSEAKRLYLQGVAICEKLVQADQAYRRDLMVFCNKLGQCYLFTNRPEEAISQFKRSASLGQQLLADRPDDMMARFDVVATHINIGDLFVAMEQPERALDHYQSGHKLTAKLLEDEPQSPLAQRELSLCLTKLGIVHRQLGQLGQAIQFWLESVTICEELARVSPDDNQALRDLAISLSGLAATHLVAGEVQQAIEHHERATSIFSTLASINPASLASNQDLARSHVRLGNARFSAGRTNDALADFAEGLAIRKTLAESDPNNTERQIELSSAHLAMGDIYLHLQRWEEAQTQFRACLKIRERLASTSSNRRAKHNLLVALARMGDAFEKANALEQALHYQRESLKISEQLSKDDDLQSQRSLTISLNKVGGLALRMGKGHEAVEYFERSLAVSEAIEMASPAAFRRDLMIALNKVGDARLKLRDLEAAKEAYLRGLSISQELAEVARTSADAQRDLMISHNKIGHVNIATGEYKVAQESFEAAASVSRKMIAVGMWVEQSRRELAVMERLAKNAATLGVAMGDWATLLERADESLPALLDSRGTEFAKRARFTEAAQAAAKLCEIDNAEKVHLYNAARVFSLCAAAIKGDDGKGLSAEQTETREQHIADALATLKRAVAAGWDDFARMQRDSDLDVLRELPGFKALFPKPKEEQPQK